MRPKDLTNKLVILNRYAPSTVSLVCLRFKKNNFTPSHLLVSTKVELDLVKENVVRIQQNREYSVLDHRIPPLPRIGTSHGGLGNIGSVQRRISNLELELLMKVVLNGIPDLFVRE